MTPFCYIDAQGNEALFKGGHLTEDPAVRALLDNSTGYSIYLPVSLGDCQVPAIIDTAAQVSVMNYRTFENLGLQPPKNTINRTIRTAENGNSMQCFLVPNVHFKINGKQYQHDIIIGNFKDQFILGLDFLMKFSCTINIPGSIMTISGTHMQVWIKRNLPYNDSYFISQVTCAESCKVPPFSRVILPVRVTAPPGTLMVTSPVASDGLLIPSALMYVQEDINFVEVTNDSSEQEELLVGMVITEAEEAYDPQPIAHHMDINANTSAEVSDAPQPDVRQCTIDKQTSADAHISAELPPENDPIIPSLLADCESKLPDHLQALYKEAAPRLSTWARLGVCNLLHRYSDVFSVDKNDLGKFSAIQHRIETVDEVPTREKLRRTPLKFQHEEEKTLNDMLEAGVIEPSTSDWASAPVLVRKKNGEVRYTVDFRKLNAKTRKDAYPLPLINECTDMLTGSVWFHTLDLNAGYWQIEIDPQDRHKSAFLTKYGLFEHVRMAQGLCNAPATFQRVMNLVLRGMIWNRVLVYLDDVIVLGKDQKGGLDNLHDVLDRLRHHNLKLKAKKCTLFGTEVTFLGRRVSKEGIAVTNDHVKCVLDWPQPTNALEVSKFLGFINYHRDFIPGLAGIAKPLYPLTQQKSEFSWSSECDAAFAKLKQVITSTPILAFPNSYDRFVLDTDASDCAIGAALYQEQMGKLMPIAFASATLTPEQKRYCTTRKELLAIVMFTRQFRHYLLGQEFLVRTDHSSLAWLFRFRDIQGQLGRWLEELSQYHMIIQHRSGDKHSNADGLSRIPHSLTECNCYVAGKELSSLPCGGCPYCSRLHEQWAKFENDVDYVVPLALRSLTLDDGSLPLVEGYTVAELRVMQKGDPNINVVMKWLEDKVDPTDGELMLQGHCAKVLWRHKSSLSLQRGVLYYKWFGPDTTATLKLVVPYHLREQVLQMYHDHRIGAHLGIKKTMSNISRSFYWPTLRRDIELYVQTCGVCRRNKPSSALRAPLQHYQVGLPGERVHIDFLGPFPQSEAGNKYVMVMVDQFTKWVELAPLPDQTAVTTATTFFEQWVSRFGTPLYVHTDQGSNFTSELFTELCRSLQVAKTRTTPYRPSSNGQVERVNRSILCFIRCFLEDHVPGWDRYLPALGMSLRATVNRSTGFTPNFLRLGQEIHLPAEVLFGTALLKDSALDHSTYANKLLERLHLAFAEARSKLESSHQVQKRNYDVRSPLRTRKFDVGDVVYLTNSSVKVGECRKLQPLLKGPYVVKGVVSDFLYIIANQRGEKVHHHDRLKLCEDRVIPIWLQRLRDCVLNGDPYQYEPEDYLVDWLFEYVDSEQSEQAQTNITDKSEVDNGLLTADITQAPLDTPKYTRRGREVKLPARYLD